MILGIIYYNTELVFLHKMYYFILIYSFVLFFFFICEAKKKKSTKRKRKHALFPMPCGHHKGCAAHNLLRSLLYLAGTRSRKKGCVSHSPMGESWGVEISPSLIPKLTPFAKESCPPLLPLTFPGEGL